MMQQLLVDDVRTVRQETNRLLAEGWRVVPGTIVLHSYQKTTGQTLNEGLPVMVERMTIVLEKEEVA